MKLYCKKEKYMYFTRGKSYEVVNQYPSYLGKYYVTVLDDGGIKHGLSESFIKEYFSQKPRIRVYRRE